MSAVMASRAQYDEAFTRECAREYPVVDAYEQAKGYAINRAQMEVAAQLLACPVKPTPPNWQHGRVLYAAMRKYLATAEGPVRCVDIGTAKGFSALVAQWALLDAGVTGRVESVDVIDPQAKVFRNSVLDVDRENRLADYHWTWPETRAIAFHKSTGIDWLSQSKDRVHVAFVDGKHSVDVVAKEGALVAVRQRPGDLLMFDDVQIPGVKKAVEGLADDYTFEWITLEDEKRRGYAVGVRK